MNDIQERTRALLRVVAERLREANLPEAATQIDRRAGEVGQPCVVAVVGLVKAGKSTFTNAILGIDLAKVDVTETTATINYFCYGKSAPGLPTRVRCFWRGGQNELVDLAFVDSLQGNDIETLRRSDDIDHFEYYLDRDYLEQVTLVDTPGIGADVSEHQDRTADFIHLEGQLRNRHHADTQKIGSEADAVIYVMNSTARGMDQEFLDDFQRVTQGQIQAFNAIAVIAKIDMDRGVIERRSELADEIADHFKEQLNIVVPISAGIRRAMDRLLQNDEFLLIQLVKTIRRISPEQLKTLLADDRLFLNPKLDPNTYEERKNLLKALLEDMPNMAWTVFTTIAREAADRTKDSEAIKHYLNDLAGFDRLREVLEQHFFRRSHILRCHRILNDVRRILNQIRLTHLKDIRAQEKQLPQFLIFIHEANRINPKVARELEAFVKERLTGQSQKVETLLDDLKGKVDIVFQELNQHHADFEALRQIQKHRDLFEEAVLGELEPLLGLYGLELEKRLPPGQISKKYVDERSTYWRLQAREASTSIEREVAEKVFSRYSFIYKEISGV